MATTNTSRDTSWKAVSGYQDEVTRELAAAKALVGAVPEGVRPSALALIDTLGAIRGKVIVPSIDYVGKLENAATAGMRAVQDAAAKQVDTGGPGRAGAVENAKQKVVADAREGWAKDAVSKLADRAAELQQQVSSAAFAFQRACDVERNRADELMPKTDNRDGAKMLAERYDFDLFKVRLEADGLDALAERYQRAVRLEDHALQQTIESASADWLLRVLQQPRTEGGRQLAINNGRTTGRDPLTSAVLLLGEMRRQQEARRPPESKVLEELHQKINGVFVTLVGTHARFLSPGESYTKVGLGPWDIDPSWTRRYLPPRAPLPGWSPCIGISTAGAPVRANDVKRHRLP